MSHWWHTDRTGDKAEVAKKGNLNAVEQSDGKVEVGSAPLGQQEGAESKEPEASGSDHAVGEASSEAGEV